MSRSKSTTSSSSHIQQICSVAECSRHAHGHGFCKMHHKRWRRYGDPLGKATPKPRPTNEELLRRFYSHTKHVGECLVWIGARNSSGYGTLVVDGCSWVAHRWIYEQCIGPLPPKIPLIQTCENCACVELSHLRLRTEKRTRSWPPQNLEILRAAYVGGSKEPVDLDLLAQQLNLAKTNICRKARELGLTNQRRFKREGGKQPTPRKFATDEERREWRRQFRYEYIAKHGPPKGAPGLIHTPEARAKMSRAIRAAWQNPQSKYFDPEVIQRRSDWSHEIALTRPSYMQHSRTAGGRRPDLDNQYFRSSWEANYARFLIWFQGLGEIISWKYEPYTFIFEEIKLGTRSYTPDFKVIFPDNHYEWHEVKGWMDPKSKTKLERMKQYFPEEKIILIEKAWFKQANKSGLSGLIPGWERR
jgi:hypothetical protein